MAYGVFIHKPNTDYDDAPSERYQFPKRYLKPAEQCVGNWIVYYEPKSEPSTKGYFAVAWVQDVVPDSRIEDMYIAEIGPGTYLDFGNHVPFSDEDGYVERGLINSQGNLSGRVQYSVRPLSESDFVRIVERGLGPDEGFLPRSDGVVEDAIEDLSVPDVSPQERIIQLTSRPARDSNFRKNVLNAYHKRCAITGLSIINGRGRAEVEAAHIKPVRDHGPDIVNNGLALSGTVHWMFDRGLIGLSDDLTILVSRQVNDPDPVRAMINDTGRLIEPERKSDLPRTEFVNWHRENCFKS